MKFFKYSFKALKRNYLKLSIMTIICICSSVIGLLIPIISGTFINNLIINPSMEVIINFCKIMIIASIIDFIFKYLISILHIKIQVSASFFLNFKILKKLQHANLLKLQEHESSYFNQRINNDVNAIIMYIINLIKDVIINSIALIFSMLFLINIDYRISLIFILVILFYIIFYKFLRKRIQVIKNKVLENRAKYYARLQDQILYAKFIKIYNFGNRLASYLKKEYENLKRILIIDQKYTYFLSFGEQSAMLVIQLIIYIIGGLKVLSGDLSIGMFTVVSQYFYKIISSIKFFSSLYQQYLSTFVSYSRLIEIENLETDSKGEIVLDDIESIEMKNISFGYENEKVIKNFSLLMNKGEIYVFLGENGSGKTTLINLLIGLYTNYTGEIKYNSINQDKINLYKTRERCFGVISQAPLLFNGTVKDNLMIDKDISWANLEQYLLKFNLITKEENINNFLDKNINELTTRMSGGEGQKINIIRELLRNRSILVLDEPTSSLDYASKELLKKMITRIKDDHIIILISHDREFLEGLQSKKIYVKNRSI